MKKEMFSYTNCKDRARSPLSREKQRAAAAGRSRSTEQRLALTIR